MPFRVPCPRPPARLAVRALVVCLAVWFTAAALHPASAQNDPVQSRQVVDRIVAVVGDDIVLKSEVDQIVYRMTQQSGRSFTKDLWMQGLSELINQKVLAEKARRDTTITVSPTQLASQLEMRIEQIKRQTGGEEELERIYGKSVLELKEDFQEDFKDQLLAEQLRGRYLQRIDITPSEVRAWFEEIPQDSLPRLPETVRMAHVVRYPKPTESARKRAQEVITSIRDSIVSGKASLEAMARRFSDDPGTASQGGKLTGVSLDELVPEFAAIASRTPVGEVSQVFYNDKHKGYHILRVNSREGADVNLNHILIRVDEMDANTSAAKEYLSAVRDTLIEYPDVPFELMARRHSEEESTSKNGGRVIDPQSGTRDLVLSQLGPSWRRTIRQIEVGEISRPAEVQLLNGERAFHIVLLQRRTPAHRVNLETDYERIRQYALQDKRQRKFEEWVSDLREEIYVDVRIQKDDLTAMRF